MTEQYVIGVDVGTGSARAGVFNLAGELLATQKLDIDLYSSGAARYEQSSDNIWESVCYVVRAAMDQACVDSHQVLGLSFDATCSLVVIGPDNQPISVGEHGEDHRNIIVWMDQRAVEQAQFINSTQHRVLEYVGGVISPEMETPKLLWLKQHLPQTYQKAKYFFDLTDFLTWKATDALDRSICTVVCKWTYMAHEERWDDSYFKQIGLGDLVEGSYQKIGTRIVPPGTGIGAGLSRMAAEQLGLQEGTPVAAGLIDAHAGAVGSVGAVTESGVAEPIGTMSYVFGTSACTLTSSKEATLVHGVWGPYYSAMIPGLWLNEAGQSAAGAAIDQLVAMHPAYGEVKALAKNAGQSVSAWLSANVKGRHRDLSHAADCVGRLVVVPEFLGNRAPHADPNARGIIAGLNMDKSVDSLLQLYVAGICGIAYGLRQIIEAQGREGLVINKIAISGGAGQDPLIRQLLADATGVTVVAPACPEPVLLGSAMLGAMASGAFSDLTQAMASMSSFKGTYLPNPAFKALHQAKFAAFETLQNVARGI
ncbi:FGGY-family carbohydrate kinase [Rhodanobacter aciditrophus]|uniref:FGGY-family carbohydrate kinase n=1 Tax=Rhodanobacter aciditrophus TaxID=1623218 RepID=A0ABW4B0V6_9GAMM